MLPSSTRSRLLWAFALSALLHLLFFGGMPKLGWKGPPEIEIPPPLEARLLPIASHNAPLPVPEQQAAPAKPKPKPAPDAVPTQSAPPAPATEGSGKAQRNAEPMMPPLPPGMSVDASYPFRSVDMQFDIYYGADSALVGRMTYSWLYEPPRYFIEAKMETVGLAALFYGKTYSQRSAGRLSIEGLAPDYYLVLQSGKPDERIEFDWDAGYAKLQRGDKRSELVLQEGTQDLLSILHHVHFIQPLQPSNPLYIATPKHIETNIVELLGEERLESPAGNIRSLHLKYPDPDGGVVEFWIDQDRAFLPVRIRKENRKGVILDFKLRSIKAKLMND